MNEGSMRLTLRVTKALADIQRVRILMMLRSGELCVCQIIEVLGLAPSTVSKHLSILSDAGLADFRKDGRWAYYRLADAAEMQPPLDWLATSLAKDGQIRIDREKLATINACDPASLARRQRENGAPGGRALPELREENVQSGRAGSPSTPNGGAPGGRALPELRNKDGRPGGAGSPSAPQGGAGSPSTPSEVGGTKDMMPGKSKKRYP